MNRKQNLALWATLMVAAFATATPAVRAAEPVFVFKDVGESSGAMPILAGIRGHGAAWGDVDGDGWPDLFVTTFHNQGSKPAQLLRNEKGKFRLDPQPQLQTSGMGSGALLADFGNTGRLDLYVSNCANGKEGPNATPNAFFRNDGNGKFTDISAASGTCPPGFLGRGVTALDFDGDGLLDLLACEQYYSPKVNTGAVLYKNLGNHQFKNVSAEAGLPTKLGGLGVAAADVNQDGWPDIFLTQGAGEHQLLLNDGKGHFAEAPGTHDVFRWTDLGKEDPPAGVSLADINRDGLPEIVIGHHFKTPWRKPAPIRLYLHGGLKDGVPQYQEITEQAGLKPLAMKAPHVEFQDFDNDGLPDLAVSIVKFKDGQPHPLIYRNLGVRDGLPRFEERAWAVNDFPTAEDQLLGRSTDLFAKLLAEKKIIYMALAPSCDFDRDGKLDLFLPNWWLESPSLLLRNETPGGKYLSVQVVGGPGVNRSGIGTVVKAYPAGQLGDPAALIVAREVASGYGYCSGQEATVHLGLGTVDAVDLEIILPHGKGKRIAKNVPANQRFVSTE